MRIDLQKYWGFSELYCTGELACRIVDAIKTHGQVTLVSKEIRSLEKTGLLSFLDEICDFHNWSRSQITIEHGDSTQRTARGYNVKVVETSEGYFNIDFSKIDHRPWNREKTYGMFVGRANVTRMYAAYRHLNFDYRDQGLTSFNQDIAHYVDHRYLVEYLCQTNQRWEDLKSIRPWSDIDQIKEPPIVSQFQGDLWSSVYEKIAIEIVLETTDTDDCFGMTEKLLRPMIYRRPFILIIGRDHIKNVLKQCKKRAEGILQLDGSPAEFQGEFRFFENVIPLDYDRDEGITRVEHAFDILHELIRTKKIDTILEDCAEDIENNYNLVKRRVEHLQKYRLLYQDRYNTKIWNQK